MPDDAKICPQCSAPVADAPPFATAPQPPPPATQTSAWLNVPPAQAQYPPQGQPYAPQGQPYPPQMQYQTAPQTDGKATASLVLGILGLLCFGFLAGLPAIILGHISRGNIKKSMGRLTGGGMALAGLIMGYVSIISTILIIAAIAIPSLLRAKMAANESAAASSVRMINTSQITYSTKFPAHGFASDLASMGGACDGEGTVEHACLIALPLGDASCTAGQWCQQNGYRFSVAATCDAANLCSDYVVTATPVSVGTGGRTFCSTSDAVIRYREGMVHAPLTVEECTAWPPIT